MTIEVADVDTLYKKLKGKGIPIEAEIRDETWRDRHFAIVDPNGIGIISLPIINQNSSVLDK